MGTSRRLGRHVRAARPVRDMLSDAVRSAMSSIAAVGGFILFSVLTGLAALFRLVMRCPGCSPPLRALRLPQGWGLRCCRDLWK